MAKQNINVGTAANDKKGDSLRAAFVKVNANFTELYKAVGLADTGQDTALTFVGSTIGTDDSSSIVIDRATTITSNLSVGGDILPQTALGGDLGSSTLPWRSLYVSNNTIYIGGTAVGIDANGNLTTGGTVVGNTPAWANITGKPTFATVSTTGAYADLTGKPTIPTSFSSLVNDDQTVSLGSTGTLTLPAQAALTDVSQISSAIINRAGASTDTAAIQTARDDWLYYEQAWIDLRDADEQDFDTGTRPWYGMPGWQAYPILIAYVHTGGGLPPSNSLAPAASAAKNAYLSYKQLVSNIDIVSGDKVFSFENTGNLTLPGNIIFLDGTTQSTVFSFSVAADDSTQRVISTNELVKFVGAGTVTTSSDTEGNITITGTGGTSIPAVVTTGAVGISGQSHVKVQFTVASATTVTAVGVTVIGINAPAKGKITLSGSPAAGAFDIVANTNVTGDTFILMPFATNASGTGYGAPIAATGTDPCLVRGTMITMADMSRVAVENITYNDDILVWDFDLGEFASAKPIWIKKTQTAVVSCLLTFSDDSELQIVGESPKAHRIFNKEAGKFTYGSMPETPIGTTTFNDQGEEITLISKEWIVGEVEFYNVMTDYHMNLFANSILTSMRYNNVYPITDMKFVKDSRTLRTANDYPNVEERLYKGFRLAEQTQSVEEIETHIQWLLTLEVERETECV